MLKIKTRKRPKTKISSSGNKADPLLFAVVMFLLIFGLVMITSIGVPKSIQLSAPNILYPNCSDASVDCYLLFKNHLIRLLVGLGMLFVASKIGYRFWKKTSSVIFVGTILVLFLVLFLGSKYTTFARSWLVLFNTSIQPTEFAKLALVLYLATWMDRKKNQIDNFQNGFLPFCVISGALVLPILLQPDLGSTLVIGAIAGAMYLVGGANYKHLLLGIFAVAMMGTIMVMSISHVQDRFVTFLSDDANCKQDFCWQSEQSKIAIGSGGFWGKGLTQGVQKSYWLPQATDDFIFAASAEELGFFRIVLVILAFSFFAYRGYLIARGSSDRFVVLASTGITTWLVMQAFINLAVNLGLMPVTGITLPFISYGGSSMLANLLAVGILLQLSKHSDYARAHGRRRDGGTHHTQYRLN